MNHWRSLHRDEEGTISLLSVFALLLLTMLLGMVMNVGRQVDRKVRMQNAADAAAYSAGVMLTRGMNGLAFTNHLLCDVFALTAYMREARDRDAEMMTPQVLSAWMQMAPWFAQAPLPKLAALAGAIPAKIPLEQQMIYTFGQWNAVSSMMILPVLEQILAQELIPLYQRALVQTMPMVAQMTAQEIARQHGLLEGGRGDLQATIWRTTLQPLGSTDDGPGGWMTRTLPVVDPIGDMAVGPVDYFGISTQQRHDLAHQYLNAWNNEMLAAFDQEAKMSQFSNMWRGFTCGKLDELLNVEYPMRNLLFVIRTPLNYVVDRQLHLEQQFMWLGVVYRAHMTPALPGLFRNPLAPDDLAFAQVSMFVPRPRLINWHPGLPPPGGLYGGVPGDVGPLPAPGGGANTLGQDRQIWTVVWEGRPTGWDALNQNWTAQLVPATTASLPLILSTPPPGLGNVRVPSVQDFTTPDLQQVSTH